MRPKNMTRTVESEKVVAGIAPAGEISTSRELSSCWVMEEPDDDGALKDISQHRAFHMLPSDEVIQSIAEGRIKHFPYNLNHFVELAALWRMHLLYVGNSEQDVYRIHDNLVLAGLRAFMKRADDSDRKRLTRAMLEPLSVMATWRRENSEQIVYEVASIEA